MDTKLERLTVAEVTKGFVYNQLEAKGLFGLDGEFPQVIQPEYRGRTTFSRMGAYGT